MSDAPSPPAVTAEVSSGWVAPLVLVALVGGLAIRLAFLLQTPPSSTKWDHHEYVRWGILMREEGLTALYDRPPRETLMWNAKRGTAETARHPEHFICNYPPLAAYLLYGEITVLGWFDSTLASNTRAARLIYGALSVVGDVLVAVGCLALVRRLFASGGYGADVRQNGSTSAGVDPAAGLAFATVMLAPPFFLDSARWTQTDSWVLAPAVWMLWAMLGGRWFLAGLLWGIAAGLKTQGILFTPVWLLALVVRGERWRIIAGMVVAGAVVVVVSLPFTLHSGLAWFRESYVNNLLETYKLTTLKAFNLWYLDLLITENPDAGALLLGIQKDTWGKLLLGAAIVGSGWILVRRRPAHGTSPLAFTGVLLLAAVVLPTRVHERYILLPIPFLIVMAALRPRIWTALVPFIVVASFQMTVLDWLGLGADSWAMVVKKVTAQYEDLRQTLPPEEFAALPTPAEQLEKTIRPRFLADRAEMGREKWEWTLTLVELATAIAMGIMILVREGEARVAVGYIPTCASPSGPAASRSPSGRG